nr:bifunctional diguanylate cyclase/phosphodiesterase [Shewanella jiangmenensis]
MFEAFATGHRLGAALYFNEQCVWHLDAREGAAESAELQREVAQTLIQTKQSPNWCLALFAEHIDAGTYAQATLLVSGLPEGIQAQTSDAMAADAKIPGVKIPGVTTPYVTTPDATTPDAIDAHRAELLQSFLDAFTDHLWIKDVAGRYRFANQATLDSWGLSAGQLIGHTDEELFADNAQAFVKADAKAIELGAPLVVAECIDRDLNKGLIWLETLKAPMYAKDGQLLGVIGNTRDIARYKAAEEQLMLTSKVFENAIEGVMITDPDGIITDINGAFEKITGYQRSEVLGNTPKLLNSGRHGREFFTNFWTELEQRGHWSGEIWNRRKNGTLYAEQLSISAVFGDDGAIRCYVAVFSDISQLKQTEAEVLQLAWHDPLTRLPNRSKLSTIMQQQIKAAHHHHGRLALLLIDVDLFKHINDSLGHLSGDKVLLGLSERLVSLLDPDVTVARIGGDEFVVLAEIEHRRDVTNLLAGIQRAFDTSFDTESRGSVNLSASIGIALYPDDGDDADTLLKNADAAMYRAKQQGRNCHAFYTEQMTQSSIQQLQLQTALRNAVRQGGFYLQYQPKVDLSSGQVIGLEALCRWSDPSLGPISPADFIPVAESIGMMPELGLWVLHEACRQTKRWLDKGLAPGRVAVNVSGSQLAVGNFVEDVAAVLKRTGLPGSALELEITESMLLYSPERAVETLNKLRQMGITLALDDFGTGYSSLSYLRRLPIDTLKIDQSFVRELPGAKDNCAITLAIIAMGEALGLKVIAEGVETQAQAALLRELGCTEAQGYLFSKPLLASEVALLLPAATA